MDLIDKENAAFLQVHQDRGQRSLVLDRRPGTGPDLHPQLVGEDVCESRLPKARRAAEENMLEGLTATFGAFENQLQVVLERLLADELREAARPETDFDLVLGAEALRLQHPRFTHGRTPAATCCRLTRGLARS